MDLQWHERTHDDLRLAWSCRGLPVIRLVGLRLCLPPDAGLSSGFAPLATVPSRVDPCGCGVAFFRLPSRCDVGHTIIFRLRRRWGLHYLSKLGRWLTGIRAFPLTNGPACHVSGAHRCSKIPYNLAWNCKGPVTMCATRRRVRDLGSGEAMYRLRRLTHSAPLFALEKQRAIRWQQLKAESDKQDQQASYMLLTTSTTAPMLLHWRITRPVCYTHTHTHTHLLKHTYTHTHMHTHTHKSGVLRFEESLAHFCYFVTLTGGRSQAETLLSWLHTDQFTSLQQQ